MIRKTILLASDNSPESYRLAETVTELAVVHRTRVVLLHVLEEACRIAPLASLGGGLVLPELSHEARWRTAADQKEKARKDLIRLARRIPGGCAVGIRVESGAPARVICAVAEEEGADLILIASHGRGLVRRLLMSSTAQDVVNHALCDVFVLRPAVEGVPQFVSAGQDDPGSFTAVPQSA